MKHTFKRRLLASVLFACACGVHAQTAAPMPAPGASTPHHATDGSMHRPDPAKMQAWVAKRMADLKTRLQITPAQEGAWTAFADSMKPPATRPARMDWKAMEKLSTPERIDKMHALRTERAANMDKREAAVKTFYAALTPSQQKVFDLEHSRMHRRMHGHGPKN